MNFNEYKTSDLTEAVVLKYHCHKLVFVDKAEYRAQFCFERQQDTDDVLNSYRERVLMVEPYAFSLCQKEVKDRLYNN